jgi:hypothetical protein
LRSLEADAKSRSPAGHRLKQADPTKKDCLIRVGDTMLGATIRKRDLRGYGFTDPGSDIFTALLF